jgi:hypothetical protein
MKKYLYVLILLGVCLLFFYKTIFLGKVPFPGDLLLTQYAPWRHVSYDGYVAGAIPSKDQYFDVLRELYPWKTLVISELKQGKFPLWNPYNFSGSPLLANYQSQVFYPFALLYLVLPQITAWTIMVILQPILGSVFMYLFATEIGLSAASSLLVSLLFNFSGFANVWMEFTTVWHTILWLPLLLFVVERGIKQKRLSIGLRILFMFGLFSAICGGHPQDFMNLFLFFCIYTTSRIVSTGEWSWSEKKSYAVYTLLPIILFPFLVAAPQLFPTIELFRNSARVTHEYSLIIEKMLVQWWQIPLIAVNDFFGNPATGSNFTGDYVGKTLSIGVGGFFLFITSLFSTTSTWHKKFFFWTAVVILLLTIRTPVSELFYRYPLPVLSTGTPTRILFVLMLAMSLLAGFGFDAVAKGTANLKKSLMLSWGVFLIFWAFVLIHPTLPGLLYQTGSVAIMKRALLLATALLGVVSLLNVASIRIRKIWILVIPLCIGELLYGFIKFNPFVPKSFVYPANPLITYLKETTGINRFWGYGTTGIEANFATQEYLYSADGTDPLNLRWYNQLLQASRDGNIALVFNRTTRSDAQLAPGYGAHDLPSNVFRLRFMDVLGVKYVIDRSENPKDATTFPSDRFKKIWAEADWTVYENLKSTPRFFITSDVRPYKDIPDFETQFFSDSFKSDKTVLIEGHDWNTIGLLIDGVNDTKLISYTPTRVEISAVTDTPQFLFLSDTFDAGWTATVNGNPARVYKANFAFRGVPVPKGKSTVVFTYQPKSFQTGLAISILGLLATVIYLITTTIQNKNSTTPIHVTTTPKRKLKGK